MTTSLNCDFGTTTDVFKVIHEVSLQCGLLIRWEQTTQTIQLYKPTNLFSIPLKPFGSIQYERYTNPTNVIWRFFHMQMSEEFKDNIDRMRETYWQTELVHIIPSSEWIDFTFCELTRDTLPLIKEIKHALILEV